MANAITYFVFSSLASKSPIDACHKTSAIITNKQPLIARKMSFGGKNRSLNVIGKKDTREGFVRVSNLHGIFSRRGAATSRRIQEIMRERAKRPQ